MDFSGFSTNGLLMMHASVKTSLLLDDNTPSGHDKSYGVREFSDWKKMSDAIEVELLLREVNFEPIKW